MGKYSSLCTDIVDFGTNCSNPRYCAISKITPHHMAGNIDAKSCALYHLNGGRGGASANYYIGSDGAIVGGVSEDRRAWTTSSEYNDQRAITVEIANCGGDPDWPVSEAAYASAVKLFADVCKRYNIDPHFDGTTNGSITMHKQYAATGCPGPTLEGRIRSGQFEADIKKAMQPQPTPTPQPKEPVNTPTKPRTQYAVTYRSFLPNYGGLSWVGDGELSGSQGLGIPIEAIQIEGGAGQNLIIQYQLHLQSTGDTSWCKMGEVCGTIGLDRMAEAIQIKANKKIKYRAYCQKTGWTDWKTSGWAGQPNSGLRLEAIQVKLA